MNPRKLKPYQKAHELKITEQDELNWISGQYVLSAFSTVMDRAFSKGSKAEYIKEPLLKKAIEENNLKDDESEIIKKQEQLFLQLQVMQKNFELQKKAEERKNGSKI